MGRTGGRRARHRGSSGRAVHLAHDAGATGPDVAVAVRAGVLLLHHGSPYLSTAALSAGGWLAYYPYLPVMALFGLPAAIGVPGDTQTWLIAVTFLLLYATFRVTFAARDGARRRDALGQAAFWLACPIMAFPLTMGINDPPVIALICLALALIARHGRAGNAGSRSRDLLLGALVLGVACAMKYTAWPALAIIAVLVAARYGLRPAVRFTGTVLAAAAGRGGAGARCPGSPRVDPAEHARLPAGAHRR